MKGIIKTIVVLLFMFFGYSVNAQIWFAKNVHVRFFSSTPLEDIEANNRYASAALNARNGKIYFKTMMRSFKFEKPLMEEHFNENYVESDKYPSAEFDGNIVDLPDLSKNGLYHLKVKGKLTVHGVTVEREMMIDLKVENEKITGVSKFRVKCYEHNITIPKLVKKNISEDIEVTINASFIPKK